MGNEKQSDVYAIGKKNPNLPFHPAVRAGDYIFVSGQVAKDESGNMCVGNIEEQTRWTLDCLRRILAEDGADLGDVVKVTVYLEDARDFGRYIFRMGASRGRRWRRGR
jgi:enamine deaminase RidA (YjgF/YER057c/UK114 family)